ncbi:MAG: hypothetical protein J5842_04485, partial [Lachnospiraceae bacterium]|nr:hypothetical protein [Lachnospiraceae bacterium]
QNDKEDTTGVSDAADIKTVSVSDLKNGSKVADTKANAVYKIGKLTKKKGKVTGGKLTYSAPALKNKKKLVVSGKVKIDGKKFTVTKLANGAFKDCPDLKVIRLKGKTVLKLTKKTFSGLDHKVTLDVPKSLVKDYSSMIDKLGLSGKVRVK